MRRLAYCAALFLALGACTPATTAAVGKAVERVEAAGDGFVDRSRNVVCNRISYRAEKEALARWEVSRETHAEWCKREGVR